MSTGETELETAERIGQQKLGIKVRIGDKIGGATHDRDTYILHLTDYEAARKGSQCTQIFLKSIGHNWDQ